MTCVAGCVDAKGRVWLAGDASVNGGNTIELSTDPKVWRSGGVVLSAAGDWAAADLLRRIDCPPSPDELWIRYGLTSRFRQLRTQIGVAEPAGDQDKDSFEILIGACGALWWTGPELVMIRMGRYGAIGSGAEFALGALWGRRTYGRPAVAHALAAAAAHCPSVRGPFVEVST